MSCSGSSINICSSSLATSSTRSTMRFPALFVNHGGGPMPLLGMQNDLVQHWREVRSRYLDPFGKPKAIVVLSAHWESDPIKVTSHPHPDMLYDYYNFPPEAYKVKYPAPGSPELATKIQSLLKGSQNPSLANCQLDGKRGYDHGVFIPLSVLYPEADIPVVAVSLHGSLSPEINMAIGKALEPLRDENVLILGSGLTFHNMAKLRNPSAQSNSAATEFNDWLKESVLHPDYGARLDRLRKWEGAPSARVAHPREEHFMPLPMVVAAAGPESKPELIDDGMAFQGNHQVSAYLFR